MAWHACRLAVRVSTTPARGASAEPKPVLRSDARSFHLGRNPVELLLLGRQPFSVPFFLPVMGSLQSQERGGGGRQGLPRAGGLFVTPSRGGAKSEAFFCLTQPPPPLAPYPAILYSASFFFPTAEKKGWRLGDPFFLRNGRSTLCCYLPPPQSTNNVGQSGSPPGMRRLERVWT